MRVNIRSTKGRPNQRLSANAGNAPDIAPTQVIAVPPIIPKHIPLAIATNSAGNGLKECRTIRRMEASTPHFPHDKTRFLKDSGEAPINQPGIGDPNNIQAPAADVRPIRTRPVVMPIMRPADLSLISQYTPRQYTPCQYTWNRHARFKRQDRHQPHPHILSTRAC